MTLHKIRYQRAPGTLRLERVDVPREAPLPHPAQEPPLPMRPDRRPPAPTPSYHQRIMAVVTPRQTVNPRVPRGPVRVTGAQLLRARGLQQGLDGRGRPRLGQRELAARLNCSRSALAEAERGLRSALPNVEEWVEAVLRAHGEWEEP